MNPEVRDQWLAALRSGRYQQGRSVLKRLRADGTAEHCCLGVLCELAVEAGVVQRVQHDGSRVIFDGGDTHLPRSVETWAGLHGTPMVPSEAPPGTRDLSQRTWAVTDLNDYGMPFAQIADVLEAADRDGTMEFFH